MCHTQENFQTEKNFLCYPKYFLRNNLHPVWYEVDDNGQLLKDTNGNKIPHFERPIELIRLSMAEKLLI
jgi:hypothetical protein